MTVEANPETVTPALAALLRAGGVNRVSLGAQSFQPGLLATLERVAGPDDVRRAVHTLRDAGFDNISLDLIYGIPGQSATDLERDLAEALALEPEHLSCYELEAKPGHALHARARGGARSPGGGDGGLLRARRRDADGRRLPLVRDGEFLPAATPDGICAHSTTWATGIGRDYLALGVGAVSTVRGRRWRTTPSVGRVPRGPGRSPPARARRRGARSRDAAGGARPARPAARRAAAARRTRRRRRHGRAGAGRAPRARRRGRRERSR